MAGHRVMAEATTIAVLEPGYADYGREADILSGRDVRIVSVGPDEDAVPTLTKLDPAAILVREREVTAGVITACPKLRVVVRYGIGVDNIDLSAATKAGVYVANVPDYGAEREVSEHALALYLAVQRRIVSRDADVRAGRWGLGQAAPVPSRDRAILGLIGCGKIGLSTASKFRALGFDKIVAFDPFLDPGVAAHHGIRPTGLDALCREADVISLHAPLTEETRHILNAARIATMKPTTIVVNVSRGGLVDEEALADALHRGAIFGAGLDVFETEPLPETHSLRSTPNTVLSDHTAWYSERSVAVLQTHAAREIARVLDGGVPGSWVNKW